MITFNILTEILLSNMSYNYNLMLSLSKESGLMENRELLLGDSSVPSNAIYSSDLKNNNFF